MSKAILASYLEHKAMWIYPTPTKPRKKESPKDPAPVVEDRVEVAPPKKPKKAPPAPIVEDKVEVAPPKKKKEPPRGFDPMAPLRFMSPTNYRLEETETSEDWEPDVFEKKYR